MQEKSIIKQNILTYLDFKGISPYKFYQDSGITRGVLSQNNGMSEENTTKFLAYCPDINTEWLLTSRGDMLKSAVPVVEQKVPDDLGKIALLEENNRLLSSTIKDKESIIKGLEFQIKTLEKELAEMKYTQREPIVYPRVAESTPELIKKEIK